MYEIFPFQLPRAQGQVGDITSLSCRTIGDQLHAIGEYSLLAAIVFTPPAKARISHDYTYEVDDPKRMTDPPSVQPGGAAHLPRHQQEERRVSFSKPACEIARGRAKTEPRKPVCRIMTGPAPSLTQPSVSVSRQAVRVSGRLSGQAWRDMARWQCFRIWPLVANREVNLWRSTRRLSSNAPCGFGSSLFK